MKKVYIGCIVWWTWFVGCLVDRMCRVHSEEGVWAIGMLERVCRAYRGERECEGCV